MILKRILSLLEMPLIKRELIELAQRKRTYVLRTVCLIIFALIFLTAYASATYRAVNMMNMLGQGREMTAILFVTLMVTIYALAPAMACGAITTEKEKQTLGLLLISKLSPFGIVVEKILSRMLPLMSLVIVASPLFAICYLFGGVTSTDSILGVALLLFVVLQITAVAIFCSALLESGIAAFWMTYAILALMYFALPILTELDVLPRLDFLAGISDEEFMLFPGYLLAMFVDGGATWWQTILMIAPSIVVTLCFPIAARFALVWFSFGSAFSFQSRLFAKFRQLLQWVLGPFRSRNRGDISDSLKGERKATSFPDDTPIHWRESRRGFANKLWVQCAAVFGLFLFEGWALYGSRYDDDIAVLFSIVLLIIAMLLVMSFTCRLFAKERERQTLDSLLVAPLSNREILRQKVKGVNRLILVLLGVVLMTGFYNVFAVRMNHSTLTATFDTSYGYYGSDKRVYPMSFAWFVASAVFLTCALGNAFIYMHIVKWTAVYFGLKMNTQMKAMMSSLIAILCLCFVPMLIGVLCLVGLDSDPSDFPPWFFSSPVIVTALNEFHDLNEMYRNSAMPASDVFVISLNFCVYGGLVLIARSYVLTRLESLLDRRDETSVWMEGSVIVPASHPEFG